jgi:hypothetical protein
VKLTAIMAAVSDALADWVQTNKGELRVADDPTSPFVLLAGTSFKGLIVVLAFADATPTGGSVLASQMRELALDVYVGHPLNLYADPGAWLCRDDHPHGSKSLLTLMDELCEELFAIEFEETDTATAIAEDMGITSVSLPDGVPLRAFKQRVKWTVRVG